QPYRVHPHLHSFPTRRSSDLMMGFALDSTVPANNPALQESDRVTVFATTDFRPQRYVTVYGAVQRPGTVAFADSMTLRDAILWADRKSTRLNSSHVSSSYAVF